MNITPDNADAMTTYAIIIVAAFICGALGSFWWPVGTIAGAFLGALIGYGFVFLLSNMINIQ